MTLFALVATLAALPAPPPAGDWVVDLTGQVKPETLAAVNEIADAIEASGNGQLGVLVVDTTSGAAPRAYATEVFNRWGIGHAGLNDGVFLMIAVRDRKAELVVGDQPPLPQAVTDTIMRTAIVANMKAQQLDAALVQGAAAVRDQLAQASRRRRQEAAKHQQAEVDRAALQPLFDLADGKVPFVERTPRNWFVELDGARLEPTERASMEHEADLFFANSGGYLVTLTYGSNAEFHRHLDVCEALHRQLVQTSKRAIVNVVCLDRFGGDLEFVTTAGSTRTFNEQYSRVLGGDQGGRVLRTAKLLTALAAGALVDPPPPFLDQHPNTVPSGLGLLGAGGLALRAWLRRRPRVCSSCKTPMRRLEELDDDAFLSAGQQKEEAVGSVDYDVWKCDGCREVKVERYSALLSSMRECTACHFRTAKVTTQTVRAATRHSTGLARDTTKCGHCNATSTAERVIARLPPPSSSSSSRSSSSSSSRSSFGGGRSSGGGSSGSW